MRMVWRPVMGSVAVSALLLSLGATAHAWQASEGKAQADVVTITTVGEDDKAYVPPHVDEPPLPEFPTRPMLDTTSYPACREAYQAIEAPFDKAADINRCTVKIDAYYQEKMLPYRQAMIAYQDQLSALYSDKVGGNMRYAPQTQNDFYKKMMAEHAASDPEGANLAAYRGMEAQYQIDRAYLADRFCFNTGCNGYPVPAYVAKPVETKMVAEKAKDKKDGKKVASKDNGDKKCKRSRKRGGALGGLLGSVAGSAAGLKGLGSAVAGLFGAVLVSEIACQLDEKEQKVAAAATVEVTEKEEVGATANWSSPTREGVGGSSTITALNTEPNGSKCLSITDIAIVEGEETRVSKRMCRKKAGEPYSIMA
jgi:surface antigen